MPLYTIYSRSIDDIFEWQTEFLNSGDLLGGESPTNKEILDHVDLKEVNVVEHGTFRLSFPGSGYIYNEENPWPEAFVTPDFKLGIDHKIVPFFELYQELLGNAFKVGKLYQLERCLGVLPFVTYIPEDIYDAIRTFDITELREATKEARQRCENKSLRHRLTHGYESRIISGNSN